MTKSSVTLVLNISFFCAKLPGLISLLEDHSLRNLSYLYYSFYVRKNIERRIQYEKYSPTGSTITNGMSLGLNLASAFAMHNSTLDVNTWIASDNSTPLRTYDLNGR
jgi:hypothetical protein